VEDDNAPVWANCPPNITVANYPGECGAQPTWDEPIAQDDCASYVNTLTVTQTIGLPSGSFLPVSPTPYVIQYVADDGNGNTSVCEFTIVVEDKEAPQIICPADIIVLTSSNGVGDCSGVVPDLLPAVAVTDNCPGPLTLVQNPPAGSIISGVHGQQFDVIITATDASGNAASCEVEITLVDDEVPVLTVTPLDVTYDCAADVEPAPVQIPEDNCGIAATDFSETATPANCPNQVVITRRWVVYDHAGNSSEHIQTITVFDDRAPTFIVTPVDRTYECLDDVPGAPDQGVFAMDNCGVVFVDFFETRDDDSCANKVLIKRRWEATDLCGNKSTHWQYITVRDTVPPMFQTTPTDRTYACSQDVPQAPVQIAEDNCRIVFVDFAETAEPGGCLNRYTITRRWYAYDVCGNSAEHWQTIRVNDSIPPCGRVRCRPT
jgi:HYR domain.